MGNKDSKKQNKPQFESINKHIEKTIDSDLVLLDEDLENLSKETKMTKEEIKTLFDDFLQENPSWLNYLIIFYI